jgi:hypothetical protein
MTKSNRVSAALFALAFVIPASAAFAVCPTGTYQSVDMYGNQICKRIDDGSAAITQSNPATHCPNGSFQSVDNMGNHVCKSFDNAGPTYYDTSKGCPTGTYKSVDNFGNPVCKKF